MPPTPPDASTARDVGTQSLAAPAAPEVRVESVPAPAHPHPAPVPRPWSCSGIPWTKLALGGLLGVAIGYAFYKWGLPLLSEKVLPVLPRICSVSELRTIPLFCRFNFSQYFTPV